MQQRNREGGTPRCSNAPADLRSRPAAVDAREQMQVELAPDLPRAGWCALDQLGRQRGAWRLGTGRDIEADRRMIEERVAKIERELEGVKRTRKLHRDSRKRVPYPIVALVGYTNAGKSTLFNRLTRAAVVEADMLFATLDPTLRALRLPHGAKAILSDTVGFISDLPTMLVAAFRATLEEVIEADVILHVRDVSHGDTQAQAHDVEHVLARARHRSERPQPPDRVWNKVDRLDADARLQLANVADARASDARPSLVSALNGEGSTPARSHRGTAWRATARTFDIILDPADGAGVSWLHRHAEVLGKEMRARGGLRFRCAPSRATATHPRQVWRDDQSMIPKSGSGFGKDHAKQKAIP